MPHVSLIQAPDFASAWDGCMRAWFAGPASSAWRDDRPTAVIVPSRTFASLLKVRVMDAGGNLAAVDFLTPALLRNRLGELLKSDHRVPLREHLRLLLALAAENQTAGDDTPLALAAKAVASAPDALLRAIDQVAAGGWDFSKRAPESLRPIHREFDRLVRRCGFTMVHELDRAFAPGPPVFHSVLIAGFNARHWPLFPLLTASAALSDSASVWLTTPRGEAFDLDSLWIGSWEQAFGESIVADTTGDEANPAPAIFHIAHDTTRHAGVAAAQARQFLAEKSCTRLGIIVPGPGALARQIAAALTAHGIPHGDAPGHPLNGETQDPAWHAWLELQQNPRLEPLLPLVSPDDADVLRYAFRELLIDHLPALAEWCRASGKPAHTRVAELLDHFRFLPETATLAEFTAQALAAFESLGWQERARRLREATADWADEVDAPLSRRAFLRWLEELLVSTRLVRDELGSAPYSRVHVVTYAQAEDQEWSHLILTGLTEGEWPPRHDDSGYLGEDDIAALNIALRDANRAAAVTGAQGEGHLAVRNGATLCLGPAEMRQLDHRTFASLTESATHGLALIASLYDEAEPARLLNPGEFFVRKFHEARHAALSAEAIRGLADETARWLAHFDPPPPAAEPDTAQTRIAYDARRDPAQPFGDYEFSGGAPLHLPATGWESALKNPAAAWMSAALGVHAPDSMNDPWAATTGQWVHRWLAAISGCPRTNQFAPVPPDRLKIVRNAGQAFRRQVHALLERAGAPLPDWWESGWRNAAYLAETLVRALDIPDDWPQLATEWTLDPAQIETPSGARLTMGRSRIDLILSRGASAWIVDFKTGAKKPFKPGFAAHRVLNEDGLQLWLYALALRQRGHEPEHISLVTPAATLAQSAPFADVAQLERILEELHRMQESGVFGMRGKIRDEFSHAPEYPLATLAIDSAVLDAKWERTHPALTLSTGGES